MTLVTINQENFSGVPPGIVRTSIAPRRCTSSAVVVCSLHISFSAVSMNKLLVI